MKESISWGQRLQQKWGVTPVGVLIILVVFALTGTTVVYIVGPIMKWVYPTDQRGVLYWTLRMAIMLPVYQVVLLAYGTLFGQFGFFWEKEKAVGRGIVKLFRR